MFQQLYSTYATNQHWKCQITEMDIDSESTATSIDDENTENFCDNPTRDALAEGLMGLIKPTVDQLDERVRATR